MKKSFLVVIGLIIFSLILFIDSKKQGGMIGPSFMQQGAHQESTPPPTPAPTPNAPKTFQFDSSTNLKEELDKVNPEVLDSDFE